MLLNDAIAGYWLEKQIDLSPHTIRDYTTTFNRFCAFLGDVPFQGITADDIRRFLAHVQSEHDLGRKTIANHWIALSSLWSWAEIEHDLKHIIRGKVKRPRYTQQPIEPLELEEIRELVNAATYTVTYTTRGGNVAKNRKPLALRDIAIVYTLVDSGVRASELCDLQIRDYDQRRGRLHVRHGKNDKSRFVPLGHTSRSAIENYLATRRKRGPADPLFATRTGTHLDRNNLGNLLEKIGKAAGVYRCNPHRFRHTMAINFLRAGGNVFLLQELLGHATLEMVQRYAKIVERDISTAARFSVADRI
jgi:integrase/recombinase XerD